MYIHIRICTLQFAIVNQYCSNVVQTYNSATTFTSLLAKCIQEGSLSILLWEWGKDVLQGFGFGAPKSKFRTNSLIS